MRACEKRWAGAVPYVTGRVDVGVAERGVASEGQHDAMVAVAHLLGAHVSLAQVTVAEGHILPFLLASEGLDPRQARAAIRQAAEYTIGPACGRVVEVALGRERRWNARVSGGRMSSR